MYCLKVYFKMFKTHNSIMIKKRFFRYESFEDVKPFSQKFNEKIKGTIIEKWVSYWKLVARDYKEVGSSLKQNIKEKPLKTSCYITGLTFLGLCLKFNPDLQSFRAKYIESANDLNLVPLHLANVHAVEHLKHIERCFNRKYIRYTNLGIFSIIWMDKFSEECSIFENKCNYLQLPYWNLYSRILDIGFLNVWWVISRKMLDYDINY